MVIVVVQCCLKLSVTRVSPSRFFGFGGAPGARASNPGTVRNAYQDFSPWGGWVSRAQGGGVAGGGVAGYVATFGAMNDIYDFVSTPIQ